MTAAEGYEVAIFAVLFILALGKHAMLSIFARIRCKYLFYLLRQQVVELIAVLLLKVFDFSRFGLPVRVLFFWVYQFHDSGVVLSVVF